MMPEKMNNKSCRLKFKHKECELLDIENRVFYKELPINKIVEIKNSLVVFFIIALVREISKRYTHQEENCIIMDLMTKSGKNF